MRGLVKYQKICFMIMQENAPNELIRYILG